MNDSRIRIKALLVEDDEQLGAGLCAGLEHAGYAVDWVVDAHHVNERLRAAAYDILVLDLRLPDSSGLTLLASLREQGNDILTIIISARDRVDERVDGLDIGADDYLVKPFDVEELLARMRALLRRQQGHQDVRLVHGNISVHPRGHTVVKGGDSIELPHREFSLLVLLLENRGRVVTRRLIESSLYPLGIEIASNTVEVYIHNLRKRLGSDLIRTVRGVGYVIDEPASDATGDPLPSAPLSNHTRGRVRNVPRPPYRE